MKAFLPFFIISTILILIGCKKHSESGCVEINQGTIRLTQEERLIQPYRVHDSLVFYNETLNNTVTYTCSIQASSYQTISEKDPDNAGYSGCLGNYYKTELYATQFNPTDPKKVIVIFEGTKNPYDSNYNENALSIGIRIPIDSIRGFAGFYSFRKDTLFNQKNPVQGHIVQFYDTLTIANIVYLNVYLLAGENGNQNYETINKIFYSISDGILSFSTNRNNVWVLQQKFLLH